MLPGIKVVLETKKSNDKERDRFVPPFPTSATAKPLAPQEEEEEEEEEEEANQPSKQQQQPEKIDPSDLSFTTYDAFFVNNLEDRVLPFSLQGYNILQESITSKLI